MSLQGAIAANRFGLGAKPGEVDQASRSPRDWLLDQFREPASPARFSGLSATGELVASLVQRQQARQAGDRDALKEFLMQARQTFLKEMAARFVHGFETGEPFRERL